MDKENKKNTKLKKSDLSISILLVLGIMIVVNFLSYSEFLRFDLTENKVYSVSDATKSTLSELDDVVNIKAYFSETLPTQLLSLRREVEDVLDEYVAYSDGRIKVDYISPADDDKTRQDLYYKGIPELTFDVVEKDKRQVQRGYMGIMISYGDDSEVIPAIKQNISDLEYQLTSKIKKVTNEEVISVGFLSTQGALLVDEVMKNAKQGLSELYTIRDVALEDEDPVIDDAIDTLVIAGPKEEFSEDQLQAVNDFVKRGGALIVLSDGVSLGDNLSASANNTSIHELIGDYGIKINNDMVGDARNAIASFSQGIITFRTQYPFWPRVTQDGFSNEYSAVSGLESVVLPWVSSISIDKEKLGDTVVKTLMTSSENSWLQKDNFVLDPNQIPRPTGELQKYDLAAAITGFISDPYDENADNFEAKVVVVADSDFVTDSFVSNDPDNLNLFFNLVDIVSLDDDLIKIRSKEVTSRPIDQESLDDAKRLSIRYFNVFGMTVIVVAFGLIRYFGRRRSGFADDL